MIAIIYTHIRIVDGQINKQIVQCVDKELVGVEVINYVELKKELGVLCIMLLSINQHIMFGTWKNFSNIGKSKENILSLK